MDELLEQLRVKIESRNAKDFLESLVTHFSGHFGLASTGTNGV